MGEIQIACDLDNFTCLLFPHTDRGFNAAKLLTFLLVGMHASEAFYFRSEVRPPLMKQAHTYWVLYTNAPIEVIMSLTHTLGNIIAV